MRKFNIGDAVVTSTVTTTFIGVVYNIERMAADLGWTYYVWWNDGDRTEENCEEDLHHAKEWRRHV